MSNKTPTAKTSSRKGRKKDFSIPHPCGETSMSSLSPVQLTSTKELRMWLLEAGLVSHFRWQEGAEERMIPGTAGPNASKLFAELSQDSFLEKTCQDSLILGTSQKYSGRWPKQGIMQDGLCWEQTMSERPIEGKGSGYWPTPMAHNAKEGAYPAEYRRNSPTLAARVGGKLNPTWVEWLMGWPLGWTSLEPLEMDKFQEWLRQHGNY